MKLDVVFPNPDESRMFDLLVESQWVVQASFYHETFVLCIGLLCGKDEAFVYICMEVYCTFVSRYIVDCSIGACNLPGKPCHA